MRGLRRREFEAANYEQAVALGLSEDEWGIIKSGFSREISRSELLLLAGLWSEKGNSKLTLNLLNDLRHMSCNTVSYGPSGMRYVQIDEERVLAISLKQNNLECKHSPYNGASVTIALAIDELIAAGFFPIGAAELARVGSSESYKAQRALEQMLTGSAKLLNQEQVALLDKDLYFQEQVQEDSIFNAAVIGLANLKSLNLPTINEKEDFVLVFVGLPAWGSIRPSKGQEVNVRTVNPFKQHLLGEAFSEAYAKGLIVDAVSLGDGGVLPNLFKLAYRNKCGLDLAYDKLPAERKDLGLFESVLNETPHRFLVLLRKENHRIFRDVFKSYGLKSVSVGDSTAEADVNLVSGHSIDASLPYKFVVEQMISQGMRISKNAPMVKPEARQSVKIELDVHGDLNDRWIGVLAAPNLCSRALSSQHLDAALIKSNLSGIGSSVLPLDRLAGDKSSGIICALKAKNFYALADPYLGTLHTVAEALRTVAVAGGCPIGMGALMNVGSFAHRKSEMTLAESCRALVDASNVWDLPLLDEAAYVGLPNDSHGELLTPTVFVVGVVREIGKGIGPCFQKKGDRVLVIGGEAKDLTCTEYCAYWKNLKTHKIEEVDFGFESRVSSLVAILVAEGVLRSAHASAQGGLALSLAECCFGSFEQQGVELFLEPNAQISLETMLFGEAPAQYVISFSEGQEDVVNELISEYRVPVLGIGVVGGSNICCSLGDESCSIPLKSAGKIWQGGMGHIFPLMKDEYRVL